MTRIQSFFAVLFAAIVAVAPAVNAQTVHFVGAGSSAQFLAAAVAADKLAKDNLGAGQATFHFASKGSGTDGNPVAVLIDDRSTLIPHESGNYWAVWLADSGDATGNTNVTDIWMDVSVDSTVGVRAFYAASAGGNGVQVNINATGTDSGAIPTALWPDAKADVAAIAANVASAINAGGGVRVNTGLTDILPADALFATARALAPVNTSTYVGLGYNHGPNANIGNTILSTQAVTSVATPVNFALSGTDPFAPHAAVRSSSVLDIGAAPIIFISNNGGVTPIVTDIEDGGGALTSPLAHLFDGTTVCDPSNAAFNGTGVGTSALTLFLREPLSGTMNTFEFTEVRTAKNKNDTQEKGVTSTTTVGMNPMSLACPTHGTRKRAIGTGEVVSAVSATSNSLGYIFFSFPNVKSIKTSTKFNYLTLDGVDPLSIPGTVSQELPACDVTKNGLGLGNGGCQAGDVWPLSAHGLADSYPTLRDGTYRSWSMYRWAVDPGTAGDTLGPQALAQAAQDTVDGTEADFVPFNPTGSSDGISVYRSHFNVKVKTVTFTANNGSLITSGDPDGDKTLGSGAEAGGDEGGCIEGPFDTDSGLNPHPSGTVSVTATGKTVNWKTGDKFIVGKWNGSTITIGGTDYVIATVNSTIKLTLKTVAPLTGSTAYGLNGGATQCRQ